MYSFSDKIYFEGDISTECYEDQCPRDHEGNRECIKSLIDALYNDDKELNIEFIVDQIFFLAKDYGVEFDDDRPLLIQKRSPNRTELFEFAAGLAKITSKYLVKEVSHV